MSCKIMRMIVFFDLPSVTSKESKDYRVFRNFLLKNGFIMMQESVYSRLVLNNNSTKLLREQIKKHLPPRGLIQLLEITEKQFASIQYLIGNAQTKVIDSAERVVIL